MLRVTSIKKLSYDGGVVMGRKIALPEGFSEIDFKGLYRSEKQGEAKMRYYALWQLQQGKQINDVAEALSYDRHTIRNWISWVREVGAERLRERAKGQGRPARLSKAQQQELKAAIPAMQKARKGGRIKGHDILTFIKEKWQVEYHTDYIYTLLHSLDMVWITGRSQHPKADEAAQEAFKKTSQPRSATGFPLTSSPRTSKSGFRTKRVSASKER